MAHGRGHGSKNLNLFHFDLWKIPEPNNSISSKQKFKVIVKVMLRLSLKPLIATNGEFVVVMVIRPTDTYDQH